MDRRKKRASKAVMSIFLDSLGGVIDNVDVANFDSDGSDLKALIVGIDPVQSGTGDPSQDNVRPITGHSSVNVIVSPTLNPLDGTITNIPLGSTYYGGQLDVLTGLLTVDREIVLLNAFSFAGTSSPERHIFRTLYRNIIPNVKLPENDNVDWDALCSSYSYKPYTPISGADDGKYAIATNIDRLIFVDHRCSTVEDFEQLNASVQLCYPLATPFTVQLTGQQIATFLGTNHVWCDSGKIIHLEY